jgi:hypothetical protein
MGLKLVLAGLTGEDNDEGEAEVVNDGFFDGEGDLLLVRAEGDMAGGGPGDGAAADGFTHFLGEGGQG